MKNLLILLLALQAALLAGCNRHADDGHDHGHAQEEHAHDEHEEEDGHGHGHAEARTQISASIAQMTGIRTQPAGSAVIADEHYVQGLLTSIEGRVARVAARYPGPIRQLAVDVGDRVRSGQPLAVVESNLSLSDYNITAPITGTVMARNGTLGAIAREDVALYEIADLSQLWVDLHLFGSDAQHITTGVPVEVTRLADGAVASTRISRVLPGTATASQSTVARATLDNTDGRWRPGSAVGARITVEQHPAALAVPLTALQTLDDAEVVFVREGDIYGAHPVKLGRRDARQVEVLEGISPGDEVVIEQSYLVKADIEKAGAAHEH